MIKANKARKKSLENKKQLCSNPKTLDQSKHEIKKKIASFAENGENFVNYHHPDEFIIKKIQKWLEENGYETHLRYNHPLHELNVFF